MHSTTKSNGESETVVFQPNALTTGSRTSGVRVGYEHAAAEKTLLLLDARALDRECFAHSLRAHGMDMEVLPCQSIEDWRSQQDLYPPLGAVVLNIGGRKISDAGLTSELTDLTSEFTQIPVVVLAENDELNQILIALEYGIRGYIPTSVGIDVCVEAINLAMAGGTFVPASSVMAMRRYIGSASEATRPMAGMFTQRQEEVVRALRRGKANKIIAYELNLRESTVKVHIRNIMKKLKATNRTEVAYKINQMFPSDTPVHE
ncbi:response regulator transcription factor [Chelativorans sp. YIM 93263]|uniref:response regulator transcription factor n=1 Tax=Chelativorans sp. YIM 93263 TaxID=2906648 RepID=UPI00403D87A7